MELITRNLLARAAAESWHGQYQEETVKWEQLKSLGDFPNPDDVCRIIGNTSWTDVPACSECGLDHRPAVVQLGDVPDYESKTAWVCLDCLRKAVSLAETVEVKVVQSA